MRYRSNICPKRGTIWTGLIKSIENWLKWRRKSGRRTKLFGLWRKGSRIWKEPPASNTKAECRRNNFTSYFECVWRDGKGNCWWRAGKKRGNSPISNSSLARPKNNYFAYFSHTTNSWSSSKDCCSTTVSRLHSNRPNKTTWSATDWNSSTTWASARYFPAPNKWESDMWIYLFNHLLGSSSTYS